MKIKEETYRRIKDTVDEFGYLLIDLNLRGDKRNRIVEVFVDNEKGVSADDCAEISRSINEWLEPEEIESSNFRLDVSSPGADRPLIYREQFPKHLNRKFEVEYEKNGETKKITGELIKIEEEKFTFVSQGEELTVDFGDIKSAKVIISF